MTTIFLGTSIVDLCDSCAKLMPAHLEREHVEASSDAVLGGQRCEACGCEHEYEQGDTLPASAPCQGFPEDSEEHLCYHWQAVNAPAFPRTCERSYYGLRCELPSYYA